MISSNPYNPGRRVLLLLTVSFCRHFLSTKPYTKLFADIHLFNPRNNSMRKALLQSPLNRGTREREAPEDGVSLVSFSLSDPWQPRGLQPIRPLCPWDSPGKNTGVGCHFLLQGTFPTQGSNPWLLLCQADSLPLSRQGSPLYIHTCM